MSTWPKIKNKKAPPDTPQQTQLLVVGRELSDARQALGAENESASLSLRRRPLPHCYGLVPLHSAPVVSESYGQAGRGPAWGAGTAAQETARRLPRHSSLVFSPRGLKVNFPENLKPSAHSLPDTSRASAGSLDFLPLRLHPVSVSLDFRPEPGTYLGFGVHRARDIWHARVTGGD